VIKMKKYLFLSGVLALALMGCQKKEEAPKAEVKQEEKPAQAVETKKEEAKPQEASGEQKAGAEQQAQEEQKAAMTTVAVSAEEAQALLQQKGCFACHDVNTRKVGPSFKEIAAKYSGQSDAVASLVNSVTKGSAGKWGSIPMPPQPLKQEEAQKVVSWILSLK
jgi:cytochrome c